MNAVARIGLMLVLSIGARTAPAAESLMQELVPTGRLRVGVAYAATSTPLLVAKDATGDVRGVPRDLGAALAKALAVPMEVVAMATTAELTEACSIGAIDVGFMPVDDVRRERLDFSPPYFVIEDTYLVTGSSDIRRIGDVDRPEITVVGIAGSTTMRAAGRSLKAAKIVSAKSIDEAMAMMKVGTVQVFALTHDALATLEEELPGSRVLEGSFQTTGVAIAVHKDHPAAIAYITSFIKNAKADGTVRRAFDDAGLNALPIAPPSS